MIKDMFPRQKVWLSLGLFGILANCGPAAPTTPPLPRPAPDSTLDRIAGGVIRSKAKALVDDAGNSTLWKEYGDACLMNLWPKEAAVAYSHAMNLGQPCGMLLAHAQRRLGENEALSTAARFLAKNYNSESCVTLAHWHLEDGDLDKAQSWLGRAKNQKSSRQRIVGVLIHIQNGEFDLARKMLEPMLGGTVQGSTAQLAAQIARSTGDEALMDRFADVKPAGNLVPRSPLLLALQPLDRTKYADENRAVIMRRSLPPQEATLRLRGLIAQRPEEPFLRAILADVLYRNQQYADAKVELDAVYDQRPTDGEFWIVDSVVHEMLSQFSPKENQLLQRASTSADEGIRLNPTTPAAFIAKAVIAERISDYFTAEQAFRTASEMSKDEKDALRLTAAAWRNVSRAGEINRAADELIDLLQSTDAIVIEVRIEAAVAAFKAGRLKIASELAQTLDDQYRSIYERRTK